MFHRHFIRVMEKFSELYQEAFFVCLFAFQTCFVLFCFVLFSSFRISISLIQNFFFFKLVYLTSTHKSHHKVSTLKIHPSKSSGKKVNVFITQENRSEP